jgi:hypothetical protein
LKSVSAEALFQEAGIPSSAQAGWGDAIPVTGVYVVSVADPSNIEFDERFEQERGRWNPDQEIIYIGRSVRLSQRLREFNRHVYGARSPHRGGQAILLLRCAKTIRWAAVKDCADAERRLLEAFERAVGRKPFGNRVRSARVLQA